MHFASCNNNYSRLDDVDCEISVLKSSKSDNIEFSGCEKWFSAP